MDLKESFEKEYGYDVLSIRDFGSRAYNLDSEESDTDAMLIFSQEPIEYAEIGSYRDSYNRELAGYDLQAWNVKKFGELLDNSNPTAIEFLNSPISYYETEEVGRELHRLKAHANENFKPIALYHHYRALAENNYRKYVENHDRPTVKKNLFVIRAVLYAQYIKDTMEMPSMNFPLFVEEESTAPDSVLDDTRALINMKISANNTKIGNMFGEYVEGEINTELDDERYNIRGIDRGEVNGFIRTVC